MTFHIITFGCQMNVADSDWLARMLRDRGMRWAEPAQADIIVLNTCSVREKPELKVRSTLGRILQETGKNRSVLVAVAGCVAQQLGNTLFSFSPQVRLVAGTDAMGQIPDALELLLANPGRTLCLTSFSTRYDERPKPREAHCGPVAYVNIMQGCDNFCTYCIVPFTRGRQKSRSSAAILDECRLLLEQGAREICLLGQNVNAYGLDKTSDGTSFASLLRQVSALDPNMRLRYVTPHPKDMSHEDVALFAELPNLCPRLHLPMQAGADHVLRRMNRRYTAGDFLSLVQALKKARPDLALSTDLIVGFPGETEEEFLQTMDMVRKCGFMSSFSFCYSDRPGTRASGYADKIPAPVQLDRLQRLQALQEELSSAWLAERVGAATTVLIEGQSPRQDDTTDLCRWQGRDPYGALVHVDLAKDADHTGQFVDVTITHAFKHSLQGTAG